MWHKSKIKGEKRNELNFLLTEGREAAKGEFEVIIWFQQDL